MYYIYIILYAYHESKNYHVFLISILKFFIDLFKTNLTKVLYSNTTISSRNNLNFEDLNDLKYRTKLSYVYLICIYYITYYIHICIHILRYILCIYAILYFICICIFIFYIIITYMYKSSYVIFVYL